MKEKNYFIHPSSVIDDPVTIGSDTKIWHYCHISSGASIGSNCSLGQNVYVGGKAKIGNNVKIQNNVSIYDGVVLEDYVFCGPSMVFTNASKPRAKYPLANSKYLQTRVKEGASIGANVTIVCGNTIGIHSFIGAGSVITKDVPDYALVFGSPGKVQGWACECGEQLNFSEGNTATCPECKRTFNKDNDKVIQSNKI